MSFQKMYGLMGPSGLNMVNQAFIIVITYRPRRRRRRRRRRKIPGIGRYPMGPTIKTNKSAIQPIVPFYKFQYHSLLLKQLSPPPQVGQIPFFSGNLKWELP